jgi:multidrug resistance efflux pump
MSVYSKKKKKVLDEGEKNGSSSSQNKLRSTFKKSLLILLFTGGITTAFFLLWQRFSQVRSVQSFINGEVVVLRAPIAGKLNLDLEKLKLGNSLKKLTSIGTIKSDVENSRVSDLRVRKLELNSNYQDLQRQLKGINQQLANRSQLLKFFREQKLTQKNLEIDLASKNLDEQKRLLEGAEAIAKVERADAERFNQLADQGALNISDSERQVAESREAESNVGRARAQVSQAELNLQAASSGVQLLDGPRTLSFPEIRILELESEITDLEQQGENIKKQIESNRTELKGIQKELRFQESAPILVPQNGVVWSLDSQSGNIEVDAPIAQLLNCDDVWVEAFINERDIPKISIGQSVEITLLGNKNRSWQGRVETIRAGSGRVEIGEFNVQPPPEIARRQLPVRVATVRIAVDWEEKLTPNNFCGAGVSTKVHFRNQ